MDARGGAEAQRESGGLFAGQVRLHWRQPPAKGGCRRNPLAGPGTCWYWWEGCPEGEKRDCSNLWASQVPEDQREIALANLRASAPPRALEKPPSK